MDKQKNIGLTFVNYNYAFNSFYENYKDICLALSSKNLLTDLADIKNIISSFIYDYDYTIKNESEKEEYRLELRNIKRLIEIDTDLKKISQLDFNLLKNRVLHHKKYYYYFLKYISLLGSFVKELTSTFMPNTNIQRKRIKFSNNQSFFEKFTEHKKIVLQSLSDFKLHEFVKTFNTLITFYYAYSLFINKDDSTIIDKILSNILSIYLNEETIRLLSKDQLYTKDITEIDRMTYFIHDNLLYINSKMNTNFSNYDVLPKIQKKIYIDKTLI